MVDRRADVPPRLLPDWLIGHGRVAVTNAEIETLLGVSAQQACQIAGRWHAKTLAFSPTRGLQVVIPAEFRSWGATPADYFVDYMMKHLGHDYYVGFLSAAEMHGAAHQKPQVFQIVTNARLRNRKFGRIRLNFHTLEATASRPTVRMRTETGYITVATVATTILDLATRPRLGAGTSNVATIIGDLLYDDDPNKVDIEALAALSRDYPAASGRRAGWLIEFMSEEVGIPIDVGPLHDAVDRSGEPTRLIASDGRHGTIDKRWNLFLNGPVEHDL